MKHVYLAPHLDDGVLCCGGMIHRQVAAGEQVLVVTLFAGDPPSGHPLSVFARGQPAHQAGAPRPMALRRAEDLAALTLLGAEAGHLPLQDAVYRSRRGPQANATTQAGAAAQGEDAREWLYTDLAELLGEVHGSDPVTPEALATAVAACLPGDEPLTLYAPLAVGRHVDHQLVHGAARLLLERGRRLAFYEDYPYAEQPGAVEAALADAEAEGWSVEAVALEPADLTAKVAALAYYHSQLAALFDDVGAMPSRVWSFAVDRTSGAGLAERVWWPQEEGPGHG